MRTRFEAIVYEVISNTDGAEVRLNGLAKPEDYARLWVGAAEVPEWHALIGKHVLVTFTPLVDPGNG